MFGQGGFSINKLFNRVSDPQKNQQSPTKDVNSPDSEEGLPIGDGSDTAAEGFLCPTCMLAFPNPEMLQNHYESSHIEDTQEQLRGQFICPACKMRLGSDIELQSHYTRHHTENQVRSGDLSSLKQELSELHTSLKEEKWYSDELKKEVFRLQTLITSRADGDASQIENEMLRSQTRVLEEAKNLAVSELFLLRQQLEESKENSKSSKLEKEAVEQKTAVLAGELADLKAKYDEMTSERAALEYRVAVQEEELDQLNSEAQQSPGAEDVHVLKEELISVQKMMDDLTLNKQAEKEELEKQLTRLRDKFDELLLTNQELEARLRAVPNQAELDQLRKGQMLSQEGINKNMELKNALNSAQANLQEARDDLCQKDSEIEHMRQMGEEASTSIATMRDQLAEIQTKLDAASSEREYLERVLAQERTECQRDKALLSADQEQLEHSLKVRLSEQEELKQELSTIQSRYQVECVLASELKVQVLERTSKLEEVEQQMESRLAELQAEIQKSKETVERLESERTQLYKKIEEGDGANTAIQHLQAENLSLQDDLESKKEALTKISQDHKLQLENFGSQIKDLKVQLQNNKDKYDRMEAESKDLKTKLSSSQEKCQNVEMDLRSKSELMVSNEAASSAQRYELEQQLKVALARLDEKEKHVGVQADKLNQLTSMGNKHKEECVRLATLLKQEGEKTTELKSTCNRLASELNTKGEEILVLLRDKENLNQTLNHLQSVEIKLFKREEEFVEKNNTWNEIRARLETQLEERNKELDKLTDSLGKSQSALTEKISELATLVNQKQRLDQQFEETTCHLREQSEACREVDAKLKDVEARLSQERVANEELSQKMDSQQLELSESRGEQQQLMGALEDLRQVKQELSEKILDLDGQARNAEKEKSQVEESKNALQLRLQESARNLETFQDQITTLQRDYDISKQEILDARDLLLKQRTELGRQLDLLKEEKDAAFRNHSKKEEEFCEKEQQLTESLEDLQSQLERQRRSQKESEQQREENESRYQAQLNVLTQNLGTLREDLQGEQLLRESLQAKLEQYSGDKLELEAKLENALDERRGLLDRCLRSEDECEKLRNTTMELRRKLDDSLAALHELGRENQALQIENTKLINRKWADDSDVTNCMTCRKVFTVTIRKHHCRNCGGIFCNECSAKTATIASFKKPVRVCENCYGEVTK